MGLAERAGHTRVRTGPKDPALRRARACYDHLAGDLGVQLFDALARRRLIERTGDAVGLTRAGEREFSAFGIDLATLSASRRPLCKPCLDWSSRRSHLGGALGVAVLSRLYDLGWAQREAGSRVVAFSRRGEVHFRDRFELTP